MTKKLLSILLVFTMLFTMALAVAADEAVGEVLDAPIPDGSPLFEFERMIKMDEIVNGGVFSEKYQKYRTYAGIQFFPDEYKGEKCVRVEPVEGKVTGYFDIGYYDHTEAFGHSLDATKYSWLKVKYAYNDSAADIDCMKFWASKDAPVLGMTIGAAQKTWDIANGNGEWMETIVNVSDLIFEDGSAWDESTVRQIRLYMFEYNEVPEATCYIAGFGLFATEEEAEAYQFNAPQQPQTEATTEAPTEAPTEAVTEAPTEAVTEAQTEAETETEVVTEAETEVATEALAEAETEAPADATEAEIETEEETAEVTEEATVEETEEATEEATEVATEEKSEETEKPEEEIPTTGEEGGFNAGAAICIIAAVVVIAVVPVVLKKKK